MHELVEFAVEKALELGRTTPKRVLKKRMVLS